MNRWTPGPWSCTHYPYITVSQDTAKNVRSIAHVTNACPATEQQANFRLIAAAPDLLEALDSLLKDFVDDLSECGYDEDDIADHPKVKKARAAIAKTKGEA